jgi:hypothetical protein
METCKACGLILREDGTCPNCNRWIARKRFALVTFTTFVIGFAAGVYTISQTLHLFIDLK